ncbi:MAG: lactate utilization protein [Firmicutes bacterium]|nr:lactate utilization protein [Bacillota bacterium]
MDLEKTIDNLRKNEFEVSYFATATEVAAYLDGKIDGRTVGFGDSETLRTMGVPELLAKHNTVYCPIGIHDDEEFAKVTRQCLGTDIFLTSVNAIAETGQMVNIDGTGNRVAGSIFGHEKVYLVAGINKIVPTLDDAIWRVRNVAAPKNTAKFGYKTPCAVKGDKCYDCHAPRRICNVMAVYMQKMNAMDMEVVLVGDELGF